MGNQWKKTAAVLVACVSMAAAGCSGPGGNKAADPSGTPAASLAPGLTPASREPITVRLAAGDINPNWDDMQSEVGRYIREKTGITLKQEFPVGGKDDDMFSLMIASNDYADLVMPKGNAQRLVDAGALIDLTPYIDTYGPNIKKVYGEYLNRLKWSNSDHAIYILPTTGVNHTYFDAGGGFEIQHRVLKELGYPQIKTVQDYENALKTYVARHPTTEDGKPVIPLSLNAGEWQFLITVTNPAFLTTGAPDDGEFYIDKMTFDAKLHYQRPEEKEYFRWLNHMNDIGLLDKESFIQKYDQYKAKIATGRVLGIIDQKWDYQDAENALKKEGKFDFTYAHFPVVLNEQYKDASFQDTGYMASYGIGITKSAKDPVRLIRFLDWLASDEGQVLVNWGIEGKHYQVENGKRIIPQDIQDRKNNDSIAFQKTTGLGNYMFGPHFGDGVKDPTGNYYTTTFPEQIQAGYSQADKETLKAYGKTTYKDFWPSEKEFPVRPYGAGWNYSLETGSDANVIYQNAEETMKKRITEAVLVKPDQFDAVWDAFMRDLEKIDIRKSSEEFSRLIKERVKLWSEK